jgi:hypothetical protein
MLVIRIQEDLIYLAAEGRLIPFLGAGFSASLGLPSWESMLRDVCESLEGAVSFEDLIESTNGDFLQVAEYLYLRHDKQIGPIRHQIERSFSQRHSEPVSSGPHVELVNLGADQIYTTNYDDIIEQTYRSLGLPVSPVILPKDVALASSEKTQIIKYHGDLSHERTLILTESAYYKRLDFESPMDLKFRSDLLGKSVLFIGYSFRDINIRIIWFKLMDMMRDIPEADRRPSYIVRFEPNAALEELYAAVGLKTIVLNPSSRTLSDEERVKLIGEFLLSLNVRAGTEGRVAVKHGKTGFVSAALIEEINTRRERLRRNASRFTVARLGTTFYDDGTLDRLLTYEVPSALKESWRQCVSGLLPYLPPSQMLLDVLNKLDDAIAVGKYVIKFLARTNDSEARLLKKHLSPDSIPWAVAWSTELELAEVDELLYLYVEEIRYQATEGADSDIAYLADLVNRVALGQITILAPGIESDALDLIRDMAKELLSLGADIYPSIADLEITAGAPKLTHLLKEVRQRKRNFSTVDIAIDDVNHAQQLSEMLQRRFKTLGL